MAGDQLTLPALNRALLARQGLLDPVDLPVVEAVEAIGAIQAQHWPAPPVALWSRMRGFATEDLYRALDQRELLVGTLLRGTLHLVSAREHPYYGVVAVLGGVNHWQRTSAEPSPEMEKLRVELLGYTASTIRTVEDTCEFIDAWVDRHPDAIDNAELEFQRSHKWRPFRTSSDFVRAPADGKWRTRSPAAFLAAPNPPSGPGAPDADAALAAVVRCHLRAFGPAAADDIASWIGSRTPVVRGVLERLEPELARFTDEAGRALYDLPEAPRPNPEAPAPVRFLPSFDSVLLAYTAKRRARIVPDAYRDLIYQRANLQVRPTFLVEGRVAGTWSADAKRHEATITVQPVEPLKRAKRGGGGRTAVLDEAERLVRFLHPAASSHHVAIAE